MILICGLAVPEARRQIETKGIIPKGLLKNYLNRIEAAYLDISIYKNTD